MVIYDPGIKLLCMMYMILYIHCLCCYYQLCEHVLTCSVQKLDIYTDLVLISSLMN